MKSVVFTILVIITLNTGCSAKPEAYKAYDGYLAAVSTERPMFKLETHPGQVVTITGIKSMALYYPSPNPRPFQDTTAQAWAPVVGGIFSTAIPVLGMFGTVYSMGRTMRQMAPYMGDGNMQLNMSGVGGEQDLRILSPDETVSTSTTSTVSP